MIAINSKVSKMNNRHRAASDIITYNTSLTDYGHLWREVEKGRRLHSVQATVIGNVHCSVHCMGQKRMIIDLTMTRVRFMRLIKFHFFQISQPMKVSAVEWSTVTVN